MDAKPFLYACTLGLLLALWLAEAAPIDSLSDEEHLRRTLYKLDSVLDELIQRTEDRHTSYKRNEDKRSGGWVKSSNPDGPVPYRTLKRGNEDERAYSDVNGPSGSTSENNLRKVLRYLADMEQKLQKRDHEGRE